MASTRSHLKKPTDSNLGEWSTLARQIGKGKSHLSAPELAPIPSQVIETNRLSKLTRHLHAHYHSPDIDTLKIIMAAIMAHYYETEPVWLFVEGRSRSGKSSVCVTPMKSLPKTYSLGELSPHTFLSGFTRPNKNGGGSGSGRAGQHSLLNQLGSSIIFLIKDFTTLMSKRYEVRTEIISQFREIHDGEWSKNTGMGQQLSWRGKVTVIAATTPAIEREWAILRDLGERFLTVRWNSGADDDSAHHAIAQIGQERKIFKLTEWLVKEAIGVKAIENGANKGEIDASTLPPLPVFPSEMERQVIALAQIVAKTRAKVIRNGTPAREILDVPPPELPTSIAKALASIVIGYAALHRRQVEEDDIKLAVKVALDSIPSVRYHLLQRCPKPPTRVSWNELRELSGFPKATFKWHLDEMAALGLLQRYEGVDDESAKWGFGEEFGEIWSRALPNQVG